MRNTFNICSLGNLDPRRAMKIAIKRMKSFTTNQRSFQTIQFVIPELVKYGIPPFIGIVV